MKQHVSRRQFLRNSALGVGGILMIDPGVSKVSAQSTGLEGLNTLKLVPNNWSRLHQDDQGARRFSSFRYVPDIDRFLLWGFHGFYTEFYGSPEEPWSGNQEYDVVAFDAGKHRWENHLPESKSEEWSKKLPPMHMVNYYQGITPGYYRPQLKERAGVLRPDLNIVGDQVAYDSKRKRMVYFTGGRTFAYSVRERKWSAIDGDKNPPPVSFGSLCYDLLGDRILLFGGGHVAERRPNGEVVGYTGTWSYDCQSGQWSPLETNGDPPPRMCARLVYDTHNKAMVIFGGDGQSHWLGDTWILDLSKNAWRKSKSQQAPEARAGHFTVYDPTSGRVIVGGGYNHTELQDMWGYDVRSDSWKKLRGEVPVGWYVTADINPEKGIIVLTTSSKMEGDTHGCNEIYPVRTTWAYLIEKNGLVDESVKAGKESELLKRPVPTSGVTPDASRHRQQMERIHGMPDNEWVLFDNPGRVAPVRTWGSTAFDTDKSRIIYWGGGHCGYGGNDYDFYDVKQNTWMPGSLKPMYPERAWDLGINPGGVTFDGGPWMRHGRKVYAYDPISKKVINTKKIYLTAGYVPEVLKKLDVQVPKFGEKENISGYYTAWVTWIYHEDSQKWEILCKGYPGLDLLVQTPHGVMGVDHHWDLLNTPNRPDIVEWEGESLVENAVYLLNVAERNWTKLTHRGPWPQNLYEKTALVYDSRRNQLILHGAGTEQDELWRFPLDKKQWEKITPQFASGTGGRPPVCQREAVYLPEDDVFLTTGTPVGDNSGPSLWAFRVQENRWYRTEIQPPKGLTMRHLVTPTRGWNYDPIHDRIFMVLGQGGDQSGSAVYGLKYKFRP
ncbi:MAG: kelch repeat-containing protein [Chryseosolibacter sp.]